MLRRKAGATAARRAMAMAERCRNIFVFNVGSGQWLQE
jgi:hypothetical protein